MPHLQKPRLEARLHTLQEPVLAEGVDNAPHNGAHAGEMRGGWPAHCLPRPSKGVGTHIQKAAQGSGVGPKDCKGWGGVGSNIRYLGGGGEGGQPIVTAG